MQPSLDQNKSSLIREISEFFDKDFIEKLARDTGFVKRESKLQGLDFFLLCVFTHTKQPYVSLNDICGDLMQSGITLCKQSLQERFNEHSVDFMRQIVGEALAKKIYKPNSPVDTEFNRIIIGDSTSFQLPEAFRNKYRGFGGGASNSALMIQYRYNLLTHEINVIETGAGIRSETAYPLDDLRPNDLIIEDLGYFKFSRFNQIETAGAFFLSRLRLDTNVYVEKGENFDPIDLLKITRSLRNNQIKVLDVFLGEALLPARLIVQKVPKKIADEKRRKLKITKEYKKKNLSKRRSDLCDINAYITNTTEEQLPCTKVGICYSLRWQIEIIFKTWKSVFNLNKVKSMTIERFECFHYGCLMLIILSTKITSFLRTYLYQSTGSEISELKASKAILYVLAKMGKLLPTSINQIIRTVDLLIQIGRITCIKENKKNKLKPLIILENLTLT
jgi:hypothetical protein